VHPTAPAPATSPIHVDARHSTLTLTRTLGEMATHACPPPWRLTPPVATGTTGGGGAVCAPSRPLCVRKK